MITFRRWVIGTAVALAVTPPPDASAQTVRGIVSDRTTGGPVRGAVVTLERANSDSALVTRSALTSTAGVYAITAPGPGTFQLVARRIGSHPYRSGPFTLAPGQVYAVDITMEPVVRRDATRTLGAVSITRATPCPERESHGLRIATLWEDARTALLSSEIARRDRLVSDRQVRYKRELILPLMEIISENFAAFDAEDTDGERWFRSPPGDSLSRFGYWREAVPGVAEFYGPDARALLSEAFVRDHCFTLVDSISGDHAVGLSFVPVASRTRDWSPADIRGTIWFDSLSALRRVEFTWTRLRGDVSLFGGHVQFSRIGDGPYVVSSWRLRMPLEVVVHGGSGMTRKPGMVEEGGLTLSDRIDWSRANATVRGVVRSANGRPLAGASVRILGTPVEAVSASDGRYVLDGVPLGVQYIIADHDSVRAFGLRLGQAALVIDSAATRTANFVAPSAAQLTQALCAGRPNDRARATLRVVVADSDTGRPVPGPRVRLYVKGAEDARAADVSSAATDSDGAVVFCDVATDRVLVLSMPSSSLELTLRRGEVASRRLVIDRNRKR